jgi:hypothetical protein
MNLFGESLAPSGIRRSTNATGQHRSADADRTRKPPRLKSNDADHQLRIA